MKTISVSLPDPVDRKLSALAKKRGVKKSAVARDALIQYLSAGHSPKPSFYDMAKDLIGKGEGPGDLSYNNKHLEGYGR